MVEKILFSLILLFSLSLAQDLPYCSAQLTLAMPPPSFLSNHTLLAVHVLHRHGDRVPESSVLPAQYEAPWACEDANQLLGIGGLVGKYRKRNLPHNYDSLAGSCNVGQLTSKGIKQHMLLGQNLGIKYNSLFKEPIGMGDIMIRSTNMDRTIQSAQVNIQGVLNYTVSTNLLDIWIWPGIGDAMLPVSLEAMCPAMIKLNVWGCDEMQAVVKKYSDLFQQTEKLFGITDANILTMIGLHDSIASRYCHKDTFPLPSIITEEFVFTLENLFNDAVDVIFQTGLDLYSNPLLYDLFSEDWLDTVLNKQDSVAGPKYRDWSAHDMTLGYILSGLGGFSYIPDPPYASHFEFELWKNNVDSTYYISILFNGEYLTLPYCQGTYCSYLDWLESLNLLTPTEWQIKCQS